MLSVIDRQKPCDRHIATNDDDLFAVCRLLNQLRQHAFGLSNGIHNQILIRLNQVSQDLRDWAEISSSSVSQH